MNEVANHLEANVARLVQAGLGRAARLDPATRARTWQRLAAELRARRPAAEFPDRVLVLLGLMLVGAGAWLVIRVAYAGGAVFTDVSGMAVVLPLVLNLVFVPVAGLVILNGRWRRGLST